MAHRHNLLDITFAAVLFGLAMIVTSAPAMAGDKSSKRPAIYDTTADGNAQIAEALRVAKRDNKRVLLQFGANWCGWCHKLHELFDSHREISRKLLYEYELVLIDVDEVDGKKHNADVDERYGHPTKHGLPVLVVLAADGKQLVTQETGSLEEGDHHDPVKVLEFLEKWQPEPESADAVLSAARSRAKSAGKNLFVYFSAPWCGWCHKMQAFLDREEIRTALSASYLPVKIDVDRMTGGQAMLERSGGREDDGIPFFVILDAAGEKLADSRGPKGNVGFPAESFEIEHFIKVVQANGRSMTSAQAATLKRGFRSDG